MPWYQRCNIIADYLGNAVCFRIETIDHHVPCSFLGDHSPVGLSVQRRKILTVIQELIYRASRLTVT